VEFHWDGALPELETVTRQLSETERRLLRAALAHRQSLLKNFLRTQLTAAIVVIGALWGRTRLVTHARWYVATATWVGIGSVIFLWVYFTEKPKEEAGTHLYEDALRRNQALEIRIQ
jgi:hypothetical protein